MKVFYHKFYQELNSLSVPKILWKEIFINFIIDLSSSKRKDVVYNAILVIVDNVQKWLNICQWLSRSTSWNWQNYFSKKLFYISTYQQISLMIKTFYLLMFSNQCFVFIQRLNVVQVNEKVKSNIKAWFSRLRWCGADEMSKFIIIDNVCIQ